MHDQHTVIAVDYDDVIVPTSHLIIDHYNQTYGTQLTLRDMYTDIPEHWGVTDDRTAIDRVEAYIKTDEYLQAPPFKSAIQSITRLAKRYELHIVTGRNTIVRRATEAVLEQYFPGIFASVQFTDMYSDKPRSKAEVCLEIGASLLIDDHLRHAEEVAAKGIDVLLFGSYPWNEATTLAEHITRVQDWDEVERILL